MEITAVQSIARSISARDFHLRMDEPGVDSWTAEKLEHVIKALNGAPVIITLDTLTSFTVIGATIALNDARDQLVVTMEHDPEPSHYNFFTLGSEIIPIGAMGALRAARDAWKATL